MISPRTIIVEACSRGNIVPRRQSVPGDILETGYKLLKGIVAKYNADNLLVWTQNSIESPISQYIHIYDEEDTLKGEYNYYVNTEAQLDSIELSAEDVENNAYALVKNQPDILYFAMAVGTPSGPQYVWASRGMPEVKTQRLQNMLKYQSMLHLHVKDVAKINSMYVQTQDALLHGKFDYVAPADFDKYGPSTKVYTYTQKSEGEWLIEIKPNTAKLNYTLKINYNEAMQFDLDDELFIPDNYIELLIVALTHKLALQYPRLDDAQMQRLENEVRVLVDNVRTPKASDRIIEREDYFTYDGQMTQEELLGGAGIF